MSHRVGLYKAAAKPLIWSNLKPTKRPTWRVREPIPGYYLKFDVPYGTRSDVFSGRDGEPRISRASGTCR